MANAPVPEQMFWIISFAYRDAHIVEAADEKMAFSSPKDTYLVYYDDLRYLYADQASEAEEAFTRKRQQVDPRVMANPDTTVDSILALPQMKDVQADRESLELRLKVAGILANLDPKRFQQTISEYERNQHSTDDELKARIRQELDEKKRYSPIKIRPLTKWGIALGLPQAGYIMVHSKPFASMVSALDALYSKWEEVRADGDLAVCMVDPASASPETRDRMKVFSENLFR